MCDVSSYSGLPVTVSSDDAASCPTKTESTCYRHPNVTPDHRQCRRLFQRHFGSYTLLDFPLRSAAFSVQSATVHASLS